jgi:hypothetical protein
MKESQFTSLNAAHVNYSLRSHHLGPPLHSDFLICCVKSLFAQLESSTRAKRSSGLSFRAHCAYSFYERTSSSSHSGPSGLASPFAASTTRSLTRPTPAAANLMRPCFPPLPQH